MLRPNHLDQEKQKPVFDSFNYYQNHYLNSEKGDLQLLNNMKGVLRLNAVDGNTCVYYTYTADFYVRYILTFGWEYIRNRVDHLPPGELQTMLVDELNRCEDFEKYRTYSLLSFLKKYHQDAYLKTMMDDVAPFVSLQQLAGFVRRNNDMPQFSRLCAILIAYLVPTIYADNSEDLWFQITDIFYSEISDENRVQICEEVIRMANEYLKDTEVGAVLPEPPYTYPAIPVTKIKPKEFVALFSDYARESEDISLNRNSQIHIGQQTFYKPYMQLYPIYVNLFENHGAKCFDGLRTTLPESVRKKLDLFDYTYFKYQDSERQRFCDYLSMLDCEYLADKLLPYVPVSLESVRLFISWNCYGKYETENVYLALLMTYWLYDKEDLSFESSSFIYYFISSNLPTSPNGAEYVIDNTKTKTDLRVYANRIIDEINYYGGLLNLPLITKGSSPSRAVDTGKFNLPWKYVDFYDRYFLLYHPLHYKETGYKPLRVDCYASRKSFNEIRMYFQNFVPRLKVKSQKGIIVRLLNENSVFSLDDYVQTVYYKTSRNKGKVKIERKSREGKICASYSKSEAKRMVDTHKSYYLDQLCKMQLPDHRVYHCAELRATETSYAQETAFIFVIKDDKNHVILAFENTLDSRSTLLFTVKKKAMNHAIGIINMFLSSGELNKRQLLQWRSYDFNDKSIVAYNRIIHTTTWEWNAAIRRHL